MRKGGSEKRMREQVTCLQGAEIQSKMLRPPCAGQWSYCIQWFFSLSLRLRAQIVGSGRWMMFEPMMLTSAMPEWSSLEK